MSSTSLAAGLAQFKINNPLKRIKLPVLVPNEDSPNNFKEKSFDFCYYENGEPESKKSNTSETIPLICLGSVSGSADQFFELVNILSGRGYHVIALDIPNTYSIREFLYAFEKFLNKIVKAEKMHFLGIGLGGFLIQAFAVNRTRFVKSIILSNTFISTELFHNNASWVSDYYRYIPGFVLRNMMLSGFPKVKQVKEIVESVDFMINQVEHLSQVQMASRMSLNAEPFDEVAKFDQELAEELSENMTIIEVMDNNTYTEQMKNDLLKKYSQARIAYVKKGGVFPQLSGPEEFAMYIQVHLRRYEESHQNVEQETSTQQELSGSVVEENL